MPLRERTSCLFYLVFFLISPGLANAKYDGQNIQGEKIRWRGLSLKLYGGVNDIAVGDLNKGLEGLIDLWNVPHGIAVADKYNPVHFGPDLGGELTFSLTPRLGIGLGIGFIQACKESTIEIADSEDPTEPIHFYTDILKPSVRAIPLTLGLHYAVWTGGGFNLEVSSGIGLYFGKAGLDDILREKGSAISNQRSWEGTSQAIGFHVGLGMELHLSPSISFVVDVLGRYGKLRNIKGDLIENGSTSKDAVLWFCEQGAYPLIIIDNSPPPAWRYSSIRKGEVDLSGVSARVGIKIKFRQGNA
jgi:hypothetical protein